MTAKKRTRDPGTQQMRKCTGICKMLKGINAFVGESTVCRSCTNRVPPTPPPTGPTAEELQHDSDFLAFSRKVREAAGVPAGGSR